MARKTTKSEHAKGVEYTRQFAGVTVVFLAAEIGRVGAMLSREVENEATDLLRQAYLSGLIAGYSAILTDATKGA